MRSIRVTLDAIHQDGKVRKAPPFENEAIAVFRKRPLNRRDVKKDRPLPFVDEYLCKAGADKTGPTGDHGCHGESL